MSGTGDVGQADGGSDEGSGANGGGPADGITGGGSEGEGSGAHGGGPADGTTGGGSGGEGSGDAAPAASASGASGTGTAAGATAVPARSADPGELLGELRAVRRRARLARHAYWFPLVLFGLLTCASVPFYLPRSLGRGEATYSYSRLPGPAFLQSGYLGGLGMSSYRGTAYYWLGAMLLGIAATVFWYRWRGNRIGLRTPARGYLVTGLVIIALALLIPLVSRRGVLLMPGDLVGRGTFPFVLVGLGLCFLAWAERSVGLAVIAAVYLGLALVASLYDIENVFYNWFGLSLGPTVSALPNVVLPALLLLITGVGAWVGQRRYRPPADPEAAEG